MKNHLLKTLFILFTINISFSQAWMTDLGIAKKLALVQDKMVLMVWEESTKYQYSVLVNDDKGRTVFIQNLFEDENVSPLIWKHFIPVIVNEDQYADLYYEIKGKRNQNYMDKFNDESIKILDVNGNILNANDFSEDYQNITKLIKKYALNTELLKPELLGYRKEKNFYSAYYLASKYLDFALFASPNIRPSIIALSNIYLEEAKSFSEQNTDEDEIVLKQRSDLLKIQESLILKRPRKVLRQLKKIKADTIENSNENFIAFLYYTAYMSLEDSENAELWKSKVSLVNLKKAKLIINLNT
ncbi:hypothetical protein [Winogradskyella sp. PG-2]|uniref:hypothetical protein n=1 Tax=Winogradskyella sp. PG-2 TaxID=754409 RepID=UPI000458957D|nr:hypothetical protein [Winogradskyella sp. PG-2]BAO76648.1 hypothetical protein WPG_2418 [Winogradskyella sp. PG-2]